MTVSFPIPPSHHFQLRTSQRKPMCSPNQPCKMLLMGSLPQHPQAHSLQSGYPTSCLPLSLRNTSDSSWLAGSKTYISILWSFSSRQSVNFHIPNPLNNEYYDSHFTLENSEAGKSYAIWLGSQGPINKVNICLHISLGPRLLLFLICADLLSACRGRGLCLTHLCICCLGTCLQWVLSSCSSQEISLLLLIGLHSESRQYK